MKTYVYNTYLRKDRRWSSRCPLCEVQFFKHDLLESFNTFADHLKEKHPAADSRHRAHAESISCKRCGFSKSAHIDGKYCPDCREGGTFQ